MTETTTTENAIDHFDTVRYQLERIEDLYACGHYDRADAAMFQLKELMNSLHNHIWLMHHKKS